MTGTVHIPVISIGSEGTLDDDGLQRLTDACMLHGFFYLKNEKPNGEGYHIDPSVVSRAWDVAKEIFEVPQDAKEKVNVAHNNSNRGYFNSLGYLELNKDPNGISIRDSKEGFFFGSDNFLAPGNLAPEGKEALIPDVEAYMRMCMAVCQDVMKAIATTGLMSQLQSEEREPETFVNKYLSDPVYMLKLLKYPPHDGNTDAHTDYGCITLLLPGDEGLQICVNNEWHDVPVIPNAFVINFGDLLQFWSNSVIKSTIHRVIYRSADPNKYRYSIPFFMHPNRGSQIRAGPENVIDSYDYVVSRFDKTYAHRKKAAEEAAAAMAAVTESAAMAAVTESAAMAAVTESAAMAAVTESAATGPSAVSVHV
ncbi:hypothetical protein CEUSTIGMA_g7601.t1 [Chlamydomonas eustigma]|uniref:Fe2OG dioxygenase domain-containing protein n=1 Tax=Chlamydomonas eustigma TaxID=1157962 RepID=A0A250XAL8_9CHLO|nr:hypothetical protein CEUSTIGMA_g7601.t1 [Chlamydomonas eustigma]|eukprot:GAX80163.1 hypothetical protein CEUSTIGMA_g7601.t1 [Chlamydomonas eustigma]